MKKEKETNDIEQEISNIVNDLLKNSKINENDLQKEFIDLPYLYAYWLSELTTLKAQLSREKGELNKMEAELYLKLKNKNSSQKLTEATIHNMIILNDKWQEKSKEIDRLEYVVSILSVYIKALEKKSDMLVSLGAMKRKEIDLVK